MADLDALIRDVQRCMICAAHLPLGPRPVFQIHQDARILITSQAPGRRVHETGIPFDDPSGDRLRDWTGISHKVFYDPHQIAILPMGFCYPGKGKSGDLPPRPECAPAWRDKLLSHLQNLELTLLVGQYAITHHFSGKNQNSYKTLTDTVRAWREFWPTVVPLPHPSPRNNPWLKRHPWFEAELVPALRTRVAEILNSGISEAP